MLSKKLIQTLLLITIFSAFDTSTNTACAAPPSSQNDKLVDESGEKVDTSWRRTRFGWQRDIDWMDHHSFDASPPMIHPLIWGPALILLVFAVSVWANNEWEFEQMFYDEAGTG